MKNYLLFIGLYILTCSLTAKEIPFSKDYIVLLLESSGLPNVQSRLLF